MCADNGLTATASTPYLVRLAPSLADSERDVIVANLRLLSADYIADINLQAANASDRMVEDNALTIAALVDGRGLACPMPLLKTKVALRNMAIGDSLYVIATDANSQADINAFCQQTRQVTTVPCLQLMLNQSTTESTINSIEQPTVDTKTSASFDTIFHFIITKTDSN